MRYNIRKWNDEGYYDHLYHTADFDLIKPHHKSACALLDAAVCGEREVTILDVGTLYAYPNTRDYYLD